MQNARIAAAVPETYSIVVVDDVPEIREILGFLLEESGWFRIAGEARSGEEAILAAAEHQPDLVLLDLDLPDMTGWAALPAIRERAPNAAVVILSGTADHLAPVEEHLRRLASAVVEKGTSSRHLITRLLEVVGASRVSGAPAQAPDGTDRREVPGVHDANAWLAAVVNSSNDAVIGKLLDGTVVSWNPAAERLYGYAAGEVIGRSIRVVVPPDRPNEIDEILAIVRRGERVESYETVRVHKDGTRIDVSLTISPVISATGEILGASTVARDITARRHTDMALARAITQLERRNRELLRSNEELDTFAAVASHDLAQPLQVAYGFLDMLNSDYAAALPATGQAWLRSSLASLDRMRNLVHDILRYARTGAGEQLAKPIAVREVIDVATAAVSVAVEERAAELTVDVPGGLRVLGDEGQLALVLQNLLANAVKFVPPDRTPRVAVTARSADGDILVRVADNGVGIEPEHRSAVFEMFQRGTATIAGGYAGTGLGLAIVKKIVLRHGGAVWVEDHDDEGTVIALRLPSVPSEVGRD